MGRRGRGQRVRGRRLRHRLTRTVQGGGGVDLGYRATVLPLLVLTLIVLVRQGVAGTDQATP
jgi:hypothetical protein